ncbi:MAG: hypothetical protein AAF725_04645 [Acidobacteriota bacterium]
MPSPKGPARRRLFRSVSRSAALAFFLSAAFSAAVVGILTARDLDAVENAAAVRVWIQRVGAVDP